MVSIERQSSIHSIEAKCMRSLCRMLMFPVKLEDQQIVNISCTFNKNSLIFNSIYRVYVNLLRRLIQPNDLYKQGH